MHSTLPLVVLASLALGPLALSGTVSESQAKWHKQYEKQENAPDPAKMLLNTDPEPELTEGFKSIFNGKDLKDWTPRGGDHPFEVKDGMIVGTCKKGSPSTYLSTNKADYENFIFTCDIKWEIDSNTGVMFRAQTKPGKKHETVFGPQAEMEGFEKDRGWSGGIYGQSCGGYWYPLWLDEHAKVRKALKKDDWNRITIEANGKVVKTWVNGIPASHWVGDGTYAKGFFSLQIHQGKQGKVLFKNLLVKELSSPK